nr:ribonuclease H-like domain-containing protein [Tanacetum cinerariifolium]
MSKTRGNYGSGVVRPKINDKTHFKLKGKYLKELYEILSAVLNIKIRMNISKKSLRSLTYFIFLSGPQQDYEDLEQVDEFDLEEMDLKWQVAMISIRLKKFYKKTGKKLHFDAKEPVGFDKRKVECFNCLNTGHFPIECRSKGNQDSRRRNVGNTVKDISVLEELSRSVLKELTRSVPEEPSRSVLKELTRSVPEEPSRSVLKELTRSVPEEPFRSVLKELTRSVPEEPSRSVLK